MNTIQNLIKDKSEDSSELQELSRRRLLIGATVGTSVLGTGYFILTIGGDDGGYTAPESFPLISTRDHFTAPVFGNIELKDRYERTEYEQVGEWKNPTDANEVCVFIHGVNVPTQAEARNGAYTLKQAFDKQQHDSFLVGFSWQSELGVWWRPVELARLNGIKLAQWILDHQKEEGNSVRIVAHSLGAVAALEALAELHKRRARGNKSFRPLKSVTFLGAAAHANAPFKEYSDAIETESRRTDNFYKKNDKVLGILTVLERTKQLGRVGVASSMNSPESYRDHNVTNKVPDHNSYHQPGEGCVPDILETFGH